MPKHHHQHHDTEYALSLARSVRDGKLTKAQALTDYLATKGHTTLGTRRKAASEFGVLLDPVVGRDLDRIDRWARRQLAKLPAATATRYHKLLLTEARNVRDRG